MLKGGGGGHDLEDGPRLEAVGDDPVLHGRAGRACGSVGIQSWIVGHGQDLARPRIEHDDEAAGGRCALDPPPQLLFRDALVIQVKGEHHRIAVDRLLRGIVDRGMGIAHPVALHHLIAVDPAQVGVALKLNSAEPLIVAAGEPDHLSGQLVIMIEAFRFLDHDKTVELFWREAARRFGVGPPFQPYEPSARCPESFQVAPGGAAEECCAACCKCTRFVAHELRIGAVGDGHGIGGEDPAVAVIDHATHGRDGDLDFILPPRPFLVIGTFDELDVDQPARHENEAAEACDLEREESAVRGGGRPVLVCGVQRYVSG